MNIALVLSGGTGTRIGSDIPKQYIEVGGKPIVSYCIETLAAHREIDAIQIVAEPVWHDLLKESAAQSRKFRGFSSPGRNRQLSILHGLEDIRKYAGDLDCVLIHDAARPMLSDRQISDCLNAMEGHP